MRKIFTFIFSAALLCTSALTASAQEVADSDSTVFNFNKLDPATTPISDNGSHDGDITENKTFTAGDVTLTVTPNPNGSTTYATINCLCTFLQKIQLHAYGGSLIFTVPEGSKISQIAFYCTQWSWNNTANDDRFTGVNRTREPKYWNGSAQTVTVNIARNTQIDSITVKYTKPATPSTSDGISTIRTFKPENGDNRYYNLSGEAVSADTKGILIHDGKKILVK